MGDNSRPRNEVIRNALHRGFVGGTSGAMAMTIQVRKQVYKLRD